MESYFFRPWLRHLAAKTSKTAIFSLAVLGLASSLWLAKEYKLPHIAHAQTVNADVALDRRPNETYEALRSRAIAEAKAAATENLATNRQATDVTVTVVIRDRGQIAPILSLTANRNTEVNSDPRQGMQEVKYFDQARSLLRFDENDVATNDSEGTPRRSLPNTAPSSSRTPANSNPGNTRGSGEGAFSQPGRLVPPTPGQPGQPTNTTPFSQPGTTNPTNTPNGQTQPDTDLVPQPSSTTSPDSSSPDSSSPDPSSGTPINQPTTQPATTPNSSLGTPTSPSTTTPTSPGTGLTPTAPTTPSGVTPSQPLTPSTPTLPGTSATPTTSPFGSTTPTTQP